MHNNRKGKHVCFYNKWPLIYYFFTCIATRILKIHPKRLPHGSQLLITRTVRYLCVRVGADVHTHIGNVERDVALWYERSLMVQWVSGSILHGGPIELFLIPASALQLI